MNYVTIGRINGPRPQATGAPPAQSGFRNRVNVLRNFSTLGPTT